MSSVFDVRGVVRLLSMVVSGAGDLELRASPALPPAGVDAAGEAAPLDGAAEVALTRLTASSFGAAPSASASRLRFRLLSSTASFHCLTISLASDETPGVAFCLSLPTAIPARDVCC